MKCPFCKADDDRVVDSRASGDGFAIRRRRECGACGRRYTTYERIEESPMRVVKKDGSREPFDRRKILSGMMKACEKRPISFDNLEQIVIRIERQVTEQFDREVPSSEIGRRVAAKLREIDEIAYIRYASEYYRFGTLEEFVEELSDLQSRPKSLPNQRDLFE